MIFINRDEAILKRKPNDSNLREALRAFRAKKLAIAMHLKQEKPANHEVVEIKDLRLRNAIDLLRAWKPQELAPTTPWNNDSQLERLRGLLAILQKGRDSFEPKFNAGGPTNYVEYVPEYLPLLESWTPEGRAEARRVLDESSQFFEWKARGLSLSEADQKLRDAVSVARSRLH